MIGKRRTIRFAFAGALAASWLGAAGPSQEPPREVPTPNPDSVFTRGGPIGGGGPILVDLARIPTGDPNARPGLVRGHAQGEVSAAGQPGYSPDFGPADAELVDPPAAVDLSALDGPDGSEAPGDVLHLFNAQGASGWIPPDPVLAVGPRYIVEVLNSGFTIFSKDGGLDRAYTDLETFFDPIIDILPAWSANGFVFDPRVLYDVWHGQFVLFALAADDINQDSYAFVAISTTGNPLGTWYMYYFNDPYNPTRWIDYSGMSADSFGLYFTGNEFPWVSGPSGAIVFSVRPDVFAGSYTGGWIFWDVTWNLPPGNPQAYTLQPAPAHSQAGGGETFFVNTFNGAGNQASIWQLTGDRGSSPVLARNSATVGDYANPGNAAQPTGADDIEMFYAGALTAAYNQRKLYFSLNDDNANGASFYVSKVDVDTRVQDTLRNLGSTDVYYYYPSLALIDGPDALNPLVGLTMSWSSDTQYASGAFKLFENFAVDSSGDFWNIGGGTASYNVYYQGRNRWGDYLATAADWTCGTIWGVTEHAPAINTWSTRITELAGMNALPPICRLIFDDGFERGSTGNWSGTVPLA